jgi:hypothetical protein
MTPSMTRRTLLLGGVSTATLAAGFPLGARAEEAITVDRFRDLSARLMGSGVTELDPMVAGKLLDGFLSTGRGPDLARLAADPAINSGTLADDIVAAWYSGSYQTGAGLATFGLTNPLLWHALDFTKPPGLCGGPTGYWAAPPQT